MNLEMERCLGLRQALCRGRFPLRQVELLWDGVRLALHLRDAAFSLENLRRTKNKSNKRDLEFNEE